MRTSGCHPTTERSGYNIIIVKSSLRAVEERAVVRKSSVHRNKQTIYVLCTPVLGNVLDGKRVILQIARNEKGGPTPERNNRANRHLVKRNNIFTRYRLYNIVYYYDCSFKLCAPHKYTIHCCAYIDTKTLSSGEI